MEDQLARKKALNKEGICKLCGIKTNLIKAHIIPKTLFKDVFDNGKIRYYDLIEPKKSYSQSDTGYDNLMFCKKCDGDVLGTYDNYFAERIFGTNGERGKKGVQEVFVAERGDIKINQLTGLDYNLLKLFCLSMLLRASLTKNKFFENVDIEKFHEEIFSMIKSGKACDEDRFRICIIKIIKDGTKTYTSVIKPGRNRYKSNSYYLFYINSFIILINISSKDITPIFDQGYLKSDGTMNLTYLSNDSARGFYDAIAGNKFPKIGNYKI